MFGSFQWVIVITKGAELVKYFKVCGFDVVNVALIGYTYVDRRIIVE